MTHESSSFEEWERVERLYDYATGGYHPVHIGDLVRERYHVTHRLGHGAYATVWLVRDLQEKRWAALKINVSEISSPSQEVTILQHLQRQKGPGSEHIVDFWDHFILSGPNGVHECIVMEVLGPRLDEDLQQLYRRGLLTLDAAQSMARQLARGLSYLHKQGIVHADLHLGNVLLTLPGIESWSPDDVVEHLGQPVRFKIHGRDQLDPEEASHLPDYQVGVPPRLKLFTQCLTAASGPTIKIADFGQATMETMGGPATVAIPLFYRAPEAILEGPPMKRSMDIWALGVSVHRLLSAGVPVFGTEHRQTEPELLEHMMMYLGPLPDALATLAKGRFEIDMDVAPTQTFFELGKHLKVKGREADQLTTVLHRMFSYDPTERPSATEIEAFLSVWRSADTWVPPMPGR